MPRCPSRPAGACGAAVEITGHARGMTGEAFIEQVRRYGVHVEVDMLLADGTDAMARLDAIEWDWLGMCTGDIVPLRCLQRPGLSG